MTDETAHAEVAEASKGVGSGDVDSLSLGSMLGPVIRETCGGKLGPIEWFRSTWQRSGAATGFSTWSTPDAEPIDVMIKFPLGPREHAWTTRLGRVAPEQWTSAASLDLPTPRVVASGDTLGGYDFAWVVMERFRGHPVAASLSGETLTALVETLADFHERARAMGTPGDAPDPPDWPRLVAKARELIPECGIDEPQRWSRALKRLSRHLPRFVEAWAARPIVHWCHGDAHPGNAMFRTLPDKSSRCVLIDLGLVHAGHWVEDAIYLERLFWGREDKLYGIDPVSAIRRAREARGLPIGEGVERLADLRRGLMAACVPVFLAREGHPWYVGAALERLERILPRLERWLG